MIIIIDHFQGYQSGAGGNCPRYGALEGAWGASFIVHTVGADGFVNRSQLAGSDLPEKTACEFIGQNVAQGKNYIFGHYQYG